jgi:hypothetical protein
LPSKSLNPTAKKKKKKGEPNENFLYRLIVIMRQINPDVALRIVLAHSVQ